jgi:hypothetical protein
MSDDGRDTSIKNDEYDVKRIAKRIADIAAIVAHIRVLHDEISSGVELNYTQNKSGSDEDVGKGAGEERTNF